MRLTQTGTNTGIALFIALFVASEKRTIEREEGFWNELVLEFSGYYFDSITLTMNSDCDSFRKKKNKIEWFVHIYRTLLIRFLGIYDVRFVSNPFDSLYKHWFDYFIAVLCQFVNPTDFCSGSIEIHVLIEM